MRYRFPRSVPATNLPRSSGRIRMCRGSVAREVSRPADDATTFSRQIGQKALFGGISLEQWGHFVTAGTLLQSRGRMANFKQACERISATGAVYSSRQSRGHQSQCRYIRYEQDDGEDQ
jgi:hypothetical protein